MRGRPAHENAQVKKKITVRPPKQTNPQGRARGNRARRKRPKPTPSLARRTHTESSPEAKTTECGTHPASEPTSRPKDDTKTSRRQPENRSQEPNCSNSFIRDQIVRSRPDRGDRILKEYRPAIQSRLRYDCLLL